MSTLTYSHQWIDWVREDGTYYIRISDIYNVDGGKPVIGSERVIETPYRKAREVREAIKEMTRREV